LLLHKHRIDNQLSLLFGTLFLLTSEIAVHLLPSVVNSKHSIFQRLVWWPASLLTSAPQIQWVSHWHCACAL